MDKLQPTASNDPSRQHTGWKTKWLSIVFTLGIAAKLLAASNVNAAIYTYSISNYPSLQNNATLSGSITVDTTGGFETPSSSGRFEIGHSAITSWDFTVTPSGGSALTLTSNDINASASGAGGAFALYATPTELSVNTGASLRLQADYLIASDTAALEWVYSSPSYALTGIPFGGSVWINSDRTQLDNTFPSNGVNPSWVFATAVPEPSTFAMGMCARGCRGVGWLLSEARGIGLTVRAAKKLRYHAHSENVKARLLG